MKGKRYCIEMGIAVHRFYVYSLAKKELDTCEPVCNEKQHLTQIPSEMQNTKYVAITIQSYVSTLAMFPFEILLSYRYLRPSIFFALLPPFLDENNSLMKSWSPNPSTTSYLSIALKSRPGTRQIQTRISLPRGVSSL